MLLCDRFWGRSNWCANFQFKSTKVWAGVGVRAAHV